MTTTMLSIAALLWKGWVMQQGVNWLRSTPNPPEALRYGSAFTAVFLFSIAGTVIGGLSFFGPLVSLLLWTLYLVSWMVVVGGFFRLGLLRTGALAVLLWLGQHAFTLGVKVLERLVGADGYDVPFYALY